MTRRRYFGMVTTSASHSYTQVALRTFFMHTELQADDRLLLFDNDADFEPSTFLPPHAASHPALHIVRHDAPQSFAENVNAVIEQALTAEADVYFLNNDVVFTSQWCTPMATEEQRIISPLSNREVQYAASVHVTKTQHISRLFHCRMVMNLDDYRGNEAALESIAEAHRAEASGRMPVYILPFFCIKLPFPVLARLGYLDTSFGQGGGEDYDYCLRAYLAGFGVEFVLDRYVLHFYGKSTWSGVESDKERQVREEKFVGRMREKWGQDIVELVLNENVGILEQRKAVPEDNSAASLKRAIEVLMDGRQVEIWVDK